MKFVLFKEYGVLVNNFGGSGMTYLETMQDNWMEATSKEDLVKRAIKKLGKVHFSVSSGIFDPRYCTFPVSFVELVEICNKNGFVLDFSTHTVY